MALHVVGVFCEDIREEKSGQATLVGILPDNVSLPPMPPRSAIEPKRQGMMPKLGLYIRVHIGLEDDPGPMKVKLVFPNGSENEMGTLEAEIIEKSKKQAANSGLPIAGIVSKAVISPFPIPEPGKMLAVLETKTQRHICAVLNFVAETPGS